MVASGCWVDALFCFGFLQLGLVPGPLSVFLLAGLFRWGLFGNLSFGVFCRVGIIQKFCAIWVILL